jgi:DNA recombination protein RmuC
MAVLASIAAGLIVYIRDRRIINAVEKDRQECSLEQARLEERCKTLDGYESQNHRLQKEKEGLQIENANLNARLEQEEKTVQEKIDLLKQAEQQFKDAFKSLSASALSESNKSFLELAKTSLEKFYDGAKADISVKEKSISNLIDPIKDALGKVNNNLQELEKKRIGDHESLRQQIVGLANTESQLKNETAKLVIVLKNPTTRGRWGEVQLRRVVEIAGMKKHVDFEEQKSGLGDAGNKQRPDMTIRLPGNRQVIVDAKAPFDSYYQASETPDSNSQVEFLQDHAKRMKDHISKLASKDYLAGLQSSPEFVVMFVPIESLLSAALEHDRDLMEYAMSKNIILTGPMTLLALLRTIELGWEQESMIKNYKKIMELVQQELRTRLKTWVEHFAKLGKSINGTISSYNETMGSFEKRVKPTLSDIDQLLGKSEASYAEIPQITQSLKIPQETNLSDHA